MAAGPRLQESRRLHHAKGPWWRPSSVLFTRCSLPLTLTLHTHTCRPLPFLNYLMKSLWAFILRCDSSMNPFLCIKSMIKALTKVERDKSGLPTRQVEEYPGVTPKGPGSLCVSCFLFFSDCLQMYLHHWSTISTESCIITLGVLLAACCLVEGPCVHYFSFTQCIVLNKDVFHEIAVNEWTYKKPGDR